jgi:hypothetical protein
MTSLSNVGGIFSCDFERDGVASVASRSTVSLEIELHLDFGQCVTHTHTQLDGDNALCRTPAFFVRSPVNFAGGLNLRVRAYFAHGNTYVYTYTVHPCCVVILFTGIITKVLRHG